MVANCTQKSSREAASLSQKIVKAFKWRVKGPVCCICQIQLDELTQIMKELGLTDSDGNIVAPQRILCTDETGCVFKF